MTTNFLTNPIHDMIEKSASPIQDFLDALADAERIEGLQSSAETAEATVAALRAEIETCDDEAATHKLAKRLVEAEVSARVQAIRAGKAESAWKSADGLARPALEAVAAKVGETCGDSYDLVGEILAQLLSSDAAAHGQTHSADSAILQDANETLSGSSLACGLTNLIHDDLRNALRGYHGQSHRQSVRTARIAIQRAEEAIPEIQAQAARLKTAHAALLAALS